VQSPNPSRSEVGQLGIEHRFDGDQDSRSGLLASPPVEDKFSSLLGEQLLRQLLVAPRAADETGG
jgi:hypothetical protein